MLKSQESSFALFTAIKFASFNMSPGCLEALCGHLLSNGANQRCQASYRAVWEKWSSLKPDYPDRWLWPYAFCCLSSLSTNQSDYLFVPLTSVWSCQEKWSATILISVIKFASPVVCNMCEAKLQYLHYSSWPYKSRCSGEKARDRLVLPWQLDIISHCLVMMWPIKSICGSPG